jgi:predicted enzyme related to lactoylglutathione lyase
MEAGGQMSEPYQVARSGGRPVAGIMNMKDAGMSEGGTRWFTYLAVDDVDEVANGAETGGGGVLRAPFDVEGIGRIAIIRDPNGAAIGFITPSVEDMPRDAAPE